MESKTYPDTIPQDQAKTEINRISKDVKQELYAISSRTRFDLIDVLEIFVRKLLKRTGIPVEE